MSTIKGLSERILRILGGGNITRDSKFHILDVQYLVRDTAAKLIKGEWFAERNEGGKIIDPRYITTFKGLIVKEFSDTKENYIDMPVDNYIRLPYGAGIQSVRPDTTGVTRTKHTKFVENRAFIPIPNRFEDIYFQLPAGALEHQYGWMVRGNKIVFTQKDGKTLKQFDITTVIVDVVSFDSKTFQLTDELPLSSELTQQLIAEVIQILQTGSTPVRDVINDENPNIIRNT